jgi:aquaporin Z
MLVRLAAEAIGTFALTFVAAGADTMAGISADQVSPIARAIAPGLLVMALIYAMGNRSGAHFNPAVTLAFAVRRLFPPGWVLPYWIAQLAGAIAAGSSAQRPTPASPPPSSSRRRPLSCSKSSSPPSSRR